MTTTKDVHRTDIVIGDRVILDLELTQIEFLRSNGSAYNPTVSDEGVHIDEEEGTSPTIIRITINSHVVRAQLTESRGDTVEHYEIIATNRD